MSREMSLVPLDELRENPLNPKSHDVPLLDKSLTSFGYVEPIIIDGRTGLIISGHGRKETLQKMRDEGKEAPTGITVQDGVWLIPAVTGWSSKDDAEASAALVALNRTTEKGGWNSENLFNILQSIKDEEVFNSTGYEQSDLLLLERARDAEVVFTQDLKDAIDEFIDETGADMEGRDAHYSTVLRVYFQTDEARQEFFDKIEYKNEGKKQASIRYPITFVRETAEQWQG